MSHLPLSRSPAVRAFALAAVMAGPLALPGCAAVAPAGGSDTGPDGWPGAFTGPAAVSESDGPTTSGEVVLLPAPPRPPDAVTGSGFMARTEGASIGERQAAAVAELVRGNLPASLRVLAPITLKAAGDTLTVWVTRDYLAIGPDDDPVRMPLSLPSARAVARAFGLLLPTARIVDAIYERADLRLYPQPMTPGEEMRSNDYYLRHQRMIEAQRAGRAVGGLVAGHKKDLVVTTRLVDEPGRVAIYGWHRGPGDPIQPLSLWHTEAWEDYSHGLRLVWPEALLDGERVRLNDLVDHPVWGPVLSGEAGLDMEAASWGGAPGGGAAPGPGTGPAPSARRSARGGSV